MCQKILSEFIVVFVCSNGNGKRNVLVFYSVTGVNSFGSDSVVLIGTAAFNLFIYLFIYLFFGKALLRSNSGSGSRNVFTV